MHADVPCMPSCTVHVCKVHVQYSHSLHNMMYIHVLTCMYMYIHVHIPRAPPHTPHTHTHTHTLHALTLHITLFAHTSHEGQVRHYHIKQDESQKYFISEKHRFPAIKELIEYHKLNGGGLVTRLRRPPAQLAPNLHTLSPLFGKLFGFWLFRLFDFLAF